MSATNLTLTQLQLESIKLRESFEIVERMLRKTSNECELESEDAMLHFMCGDAIRLLDAVDHCLLTLEVYASQKQQELINKI